MPPASASFVTDTHPFLWYLADDLYKLGAKARKVFDEAESGDASIIIPSIVIAEAAFIAEKGRTSLKIEHLLDRLEGGTNYRVYPLDLAIVKEASQLKKLSEIHDRIIVATARHVDLELISSDNEIRESGYARIVW